MRYLKPYKIFEADAPIEPGNKSWRISTFMKDTSIPHDMQLDIHDMSYELRDEGYTISYQWWPPYEKDSRMYRNDKYPSINIAKKSQIKQLEAEFGFKLEKIYYGHIKDFCDRIKSYLDEKGYNVIIKWRKENSNEYYNLEDSIANWGPFKDYPMANSTHYRIEMISRDVYGDVNESVESTEQDLKDILLELKDMGYRIIYEDDVKGAVTGEPGNVKAIVVRDVMRPSEWVELPWSELKEYALRIKDYLGDKYLSFMWRKVISDNPGTLGDNPYKTIELNEMTEINDRVWSFVIKYKE
jgi:hypothetical protein